MTRYVIDANVAIELATGEVKIADENKLLAPTLLRSQTLSILHEAVARGDISEADALKRLACIGKLPIRLLGDAVLRRRAREIANQLGWKSTYDAEYVALTQLQGDAFVTMDRELARSVEGFVSTVSIDGLVAR